jgi:hypothetical protein
MLDWNVGRWWMMDAGYWIARRWPNLPLPHRLPLPLPQNLPGTGSSMLVCNRNIFAGRAERRSLSSSGGEGWGEEAVL